MSDEGNNNKKYISKSKKENNIESKELENIIFKDNRSEKITREKVRQWRYKKSKRIKC